MNVRRFRPQPATRRQQSGAVLYVSLIVLVLMALIGIVAMQVATLQERMSANYVTVNMAFQNAETAARLQERTLRTAVDAGAAPALDIPARDCLKPFDPSGYNDPDRNHLRRLDLCFSWGSMDIPADESERTDQIYQVTSYRRDRALLPTSQAVVDTVFIP